MIEITSKKPSAANPFQLIIDIVVKLASARHHVTRLTWDTGGLYDVPLTWKDGVDAHTSYEANGEMHSKLTRGKLMAYPGGLLLGKAEPRTNDKEKFLWQRKGQPWNSLIGVERIAQYEKGPGSFTNIKAQADGYPNYSSTNADFTFEIETQSLSSEMFSTEYFLMEPGNKQALEAKIDEIINSWNNPRESVIVEKAEAFTNMSPWLAIVLFSKKDKSSESLLSGQPVNVLLSP